MTTSDKLAAKIAQLIIRGEINPAKVSSIEKKAGVKLNLSAEQLGKVSTCLRKSQGV